MPIHLLGLNKALDVIKVAADLDTTSTVGVLTRLYNPERVAVLWELLEHFIILGVVESFLKLMEFSIVFTLFDVICEWEGVKRVLADGFVIDFHIVVDGFFVTEMEVVLLMVCCDHVVARLVFLLLLLLFVIYMFASFHVASISSSPDLL